MTQEVLKLALEALERSVATCFDQYAHRQVMSQPDHFINQAITAIKEALRENAMREVQRLGQEIEQEPVADAYTFSEMRFVVCPNCGNKRCPKANDHRNACTNSNEVGQKGSSWEHVKPLAQPEQEPVAWGNFKEDGTLVGLSQHPEDQANWTNRKPLYTTPPQRTWVGLTNDELTDLFYNTNLGQQSAVAQAIALLKEKNGYVEEKNT